MQLAPAASDTDQLPISPVREGAAGACVGAVATRGAAGGWTGATGATGGATGTPGAVATPPAALPGAPGGGGRVAVEAPGGGGSAEDSTSLDGAGVSGAGACAVCRGAERVVSPGRSEPSRELDSHPPSSMPNASSIAPFFADLLTSFVGLLICPNPIIPEIPFPSRQEPA